MAENSRKQWPPPNGQDPELLTAHTIGVGRVVIKWNEVESILLTIFTHLLKTDELASYAVWFSHQSLRPRLMLMRRLGKKRLSQEKYEALEKLLDLAETHNRERNLIVHGLSAYDTSGSEPKVVLGPHPIASQLGATSSKREFEAEELDTIAEDFEHLRKLGFRVFFHCFHPDQSDGLPPIQRLVRE